MRVFYLELNPQAIKYNEGQKSNIQNCIKIPVYAASYVISIYASCCNLQ